MKAYRIVDGIGSVYRMEYTHDDTCATIQRIKRAHAEDSPPPRLPRDAKFFWQIEQNRPGGRVVVAVVIGPRHPDKLPEPDWSAARLYAVSNPAPALDYGGVSTAPVCTFKRRRASAK